MFNEQAFVQRSVGTHTGAHLHLISAEAKNQILEGLCHALQVKVILSLAGGGNCAGSCPRTQEGGRMFLSSSECIFQNHKVWSYHQ